MSNQTPDLEFYRQAALLMTTSLNMSVAMSNMLQFQQTLDKQKAALEEEVLQLRGTLWWVPRAA